MYIGLKHFHSYFAYLALAFLIAAIALSAYAWINKKTVAKNNRTMALLGMVSVHTQFLFGMVLYFLSPLGMSNFSGAAMKNSVTRLYIVEHPLMMLIAIAAITIGYIKAKRATENKLKHQYIVTFYTVGLLLILSRIPWSAWI